VKVCSLYGDGFYYIPNTQTCIKFGGFLRTEWDANAGGSFTPFFATNALQTRANDTLTTRARAVLTLDAREQTGFGTLRAYFAAGWQQTTNDNPTLSLPGNIVGTAGGAATPVGGNNSSTYLLRAFIQWGGFTFGKTASFYDFFNTSKYSHQTEFLYRDYAGVGVFTYGYTQQLGNGVAATIAVQDDTVFGHPVLDVSRLGGAGTAASPATFVGDNPFQIGAAGPVSSGNTNAGFLVPDIVGAIRLDQAWGGAQIAAILHDNRSSAYLNPGNGIIDTTAHPSDQFGFAAMAGLELNLANWGWAKGDSFAVQSQYCVGDVDSCNDPNANRNNDLFWARKNGGNIGLAYVDNAFFANNTVGGSLRTGLQESTYWNIWAAIQHYWVPEIRTSLYGGYALYQANSSAVDASICAPLHAGATLNTGGGPAGVIVGSSAVSASGCADFQTWAIGSRTIWNPVRNLDIGVDVLYSQLSKSAFQGATLFFTPAQAPTERLTAGSSNIVAGILRVQYNFYP
jgi:hypothetical protein